MSQERVSAKEARKQRIEAVTIRAVEAVFKKSITLPQPPTFDEIAQKARLAIALTLHAVHYQFKAIRGEERDHLVKRVIIEKATELYRSAHETGDFDAMGKALKLSETCPELWEKIDQFHDEMLAKEPSLSPEVLERQMARVKEILDRYR